MSAKEREIYYDWIRALAIVGVVCCHVCCNFILSNHDIMNHFKTFYIVSFFTLGRYIGIPLFVMLSRALMINKKYSFRQFFKKRFNRVFVPYLFWLVVFMLFEMFIRHNAMTSDFLYEMIFGYHGHVGVIFWFVWMILIVYIAIFIINKILEYGKSKYESFDAGFINILVIISLMVYFLINFKYIAFSNNFEYYLLFIPYAIFGYYLTHEDFTKLGIRPNYLAIACLVIAIIGYVYFTLSVNMHSISIGKYSPGSYFQFIVMMFTFAFILFFRYLPETDLNRLNSFLTSKTIGKSILSISICSYGIYFVHYLILNTLHAVYLMPIRFYNHPMFWAPILLVVIFLISWFIVRMIGKIPILNKISGCS